MKILIRADVYGWRMTGLLGREARWFIGYSQRPPHNAFDNGFEALRDRVLNHDFMQGLRPPHQRTASDTVPTHGGPAGKSTPGDQLRVA